MEIRFQHSPRETASMHTDEIRDNFLCGSLMVADMVKMIYSHYDRIIIGGAMPVENILSLNVEEEMKAQYFLERREIGIINVGGPGKISTGRQMYPMEKLSCLYAGKGTEEVSFHSDDATNPARFFFLSVPAHKNYTTRLMNKQDASPVDMGSAVTSNQRTIYKYIHQHGIQSCQLVMGLTVLKDGSVWNSVPPHTHTRRMEVYFYFDLEAQQRVFHFMGQPQETRHVVMANHEAIISPSWSIHCGCGSSNYSFIWGMAGENMAFADMDQVAMEDLK